jgi:Zn-dependent peptidase ImmA (M78 family)
LDIKRIADELVRKYSTNDPYELSDYLNIDIYRHPLGNIKGVYKYFRRSKLIFINSQLNNFEQRVVCGHELGHAVLHPRINSIFLKRYTLFSPDRIENEANIFCVNLLLSDDVLTLYENYTISQISSATGIPYDYIELACK